MSGQVMYRQSRQYFRSEPIADRVIGVLGLLLILFLLWLPSPVLFASGLVTESSIQKRSVVEAQVWLAAMDSAAAARAAEASTGGKALSVSAEVRDGRTVYRVKVLMPGGRVKYVYIGG